MGKDDKSHLSMCNSHSGDTVNSLWPKKILFLTVGCINYDCNVNFYEPLTHIFSNVINYNYVERIKQLGKESMNAEIIKVVREQKPEYVFLHAYQDQVELKTLDAVGALGAKVVVWFSDDHWRFEDYSKIVARHAFCSVTTDKYAVEKYEKLGLKVIKSQWASNHNYYKKIYSDFVCDVSFLGQSYGKRYENLLYLKNSGVPLAVFGRDFGKFVEFGNMIKIFNASKINLSFSGCSRDDNVKQIKGRVFEVPMCGAFLLTEYADGVEEYFEIGKEIECFSSMPEAAEKISYYLKHEDERMEIANRGYSRALREHTWIRRLREIFREVDKMQLNKPSASHVVLPSESKVTAPVGASKSAGCSVSQSSRKRVLLTTSAAPTEAPFSTGEKRPPIGVGFLISVLRNAGHEVSFIDNYLQPSDFLETDYLQKNEIDYVGIYINTICFRDSLRMIRSLESLRKQGRWFGKIIVGGPHTTVAVETIPDCVDFVVQGEGEKAIIDIVEGRLTERIVRYPRIENLDELPPVAWDCFVGLPYDWQMRFIEDAPVFTMNTSRGCPFKCQFCSVGSVWGKKYTYFSAERIVNEIEMLVKSYGSRGIYFREDNFTLNKERLEKFCNLIIDRGIDISWVCESRVSNLEKDTIALMARAGLKGFYFGVESGSQGMLDLMEKGITVEQVRSVFRWCRELNVKTAASLIVGVPGETGEDMAETQKLVDEIRPDTTWVNVFVGIPDSKLYRETIDKRLYEYIDDRGLVYLQGHDDRVTRYYGTGFKGYIPNEEHRKDMTNRPKVSVLMAAHNAERFIEQALNSIYNQSFQDFEVVIVDDCSTDSTPNILLKMKDSRTVIYRNATNQGLTKSLNIGIKLCRGEYVARLDADDIAYPERFEKQIKFLKQHPDCIAVGSWCHRIDASGQVRGVYDGRPTEPESMRQQLLIGNSIAHSTAMVRRDKLLEVGGYNEKYVYAQDHDLWLRLSEIGDLHNIPEYLIGLRAWIGSITNTRTNQQCEFSKMAIQEALARRGGAAAATQPEIISDASRSSSGNLRFSVIMANYNNGKYIAEAIKSILAQTFKDWELIIIDDCSTDDSLQIIEPYLQDYRIRLIRHDRNKGYTAALKTGIENVRSDYFGIFDSDDCLREDALEIMYREHVNNPDAGLIYSNFVCCGENLSPRSVGFGAHIAEGKTDLDEHVASAFRTFKLKDYRKTDGYNEEILYAEDRDICYKMEEVTKLRFVPECLYFYRELPRSQGHEPKKVAIGIKSRQKARLNAFDRRGIPPYPSSARRVNLDSFNLQTIADDLMLGTCCIEAGRYSDTVRIFEPLLELLDGILENYDAQSLGTKPKGYNEIPKCYLNVSTKLAQCYLKNNKLDKVEQVYTQLLENPKVRMTAQQRSGITNILGRLKDKKASTASVRRIKDKAPACHKEKPLVSVIMPAYNDEKYIADAIKSVLAQTYDNFELIIINDGSTDGTDDIIYSLGDEKIRYFCQENRGLAATHNEGLRRAFGSLLTKLDSDDMMTPDFIERHVEEFARCPDADLIYCDDQLIRENGDPIRVIKRPEYTDRRLLIRDLFCNGFPVIPFRTCIRKRVFEKIGLFNEELRMAEDYDMMRRFVKAGLKAHHLREALYLRRMAEDSLSRRYTEEKARTHFDVWRKYLETFSCDELFPDVQWGSIHPEQRDMHAKCLAAAICIRLGQTYIETNIPLYAQAALENASRQLKGCLGRGSNQRIEQLLGRCEQMQQKLCETCLVNA